MKAKHVKPEFASDYVSICDENDNEMCRVYPNKFEPYCDALSRADGILATLEIGYRTMTNSEAMVNK